MLKVAVVMASDSDLPSISPAVDTLRRLQIPFTVRVISPYRTPGVARVFSLDARKDGYGVIIAAAGMAAHLAGALAANTTLPVIGIPIVNGAIGGMDALMSTVQMPAGIPVAAVAIGGAQNAALLAAQILAVADEQLAAKLASFREELTAKVVLKDERIRAQFDENL